MMQNLKLSDIKISNCGTHHLYLNQPLYTNCFDWVSKFHSPGIAPAKDENGYFHINIQGKPIYNHRYKKTYGYYCDIATVVTKNSYATHIGISGELIHSCKFQWAGNFQEGLCVVKQEEKFFHINQNGDSIYEEKYNYVGDFKDGIAVVHLDGKATHINQYGQYIHNQWFKNLGIYHKGFAIAEDFRGWFHINSQGQAIYRDRYKSIEPFYNDLAIVETFDHDIVQIDENNNIASQLDYNAQKVQLDDISADMVGFWKTYFIYTAAKIKIFDYLPSTLKELAIKVKLPCSNLYRFLNALIEMRLVELKDNLYKLTSKGALFLKYSYLKDAAIMWRNAAQQDWLTISYTLKQNQIKSHLNFKEKETNAALLNIYQRALDGYVENDVCDIVNFIAKRQYKNTICLGSSAELLANKIKDVKPTIYIDHNTEATAISKNYDTCILLKVFMNHDDKNALNILNKIKENNINSIVIFETITSCNSASGGMLDINMMVESGGKLRNSKDFSILLEKYNYQIKQIHEINSYLHGIEVISKDV